MEGPLTVLKTELRSRPWLALPMAREDEDLAYWQWMEQGQLVRGDLAHPWIAFEARLDELEETIDRLAELRFNGLERQSRDFDRVDDLVLRAALSSAWIENNKLTLDKAVEVAARPPAAGPPGEHDALEFWNLHGAIRSPAGRDASAPLDLDRILDMHRVMLQGLMKDERFRAGEWREHGVRVGSYIAPQADEVPKLMSSLVHWLQNGFGNCLSDPSPRGAAVAAIRAFYGHLCLEQIHPFMDGNGRMGRWLETRLLLEHPRISLADAYGGALYYWDNRPEYYQALDNSACCHSPFEFISYCADRLLRADP